MVMLPAVVVSNAVLVLLVRVVSARAASVNGAASSAAVAAESIKRCFKIQTSLNVGQGPARSLFNCLGWQTLDLAPAFRIAALLLPPWSARDPPRPAFVPGP